MAVRYERRRILAISYTTMGCYRELIKGFSSYGNNEGRWQLELCPGDISPFQKIEDFKPDGLLLGAADDLNVRRLSPKLAIVAVCRNDADFADPYPAVDSDNVAVGRLGAEHLLAKGFRSYAFAGRIGADWSAARRDGFFDAVKLSGYAPSFVEIEMGVTTPVSQISKLTELLKQKPKPLGVLACNDSTARIVNRLCIDLGFRIPYDVAILGVDNDDLSTALCNPPLSSVIIPWRSMGREAALLLDRIIDGEKIEPVLKQFGPVGIAERESTIGDAIADEQIRVAVRFIREHAGSRIAVNEIVEAAGTTRRALERKFRLLIGRSPLEELRRCRIQRAKLLLTETDLTIKQIARQSGFGGVTWFTTAFRNVAGESPAKYRGKTKGR